MKKNFSKSITMVMAMLLVFSICIQAKANNYQDTYYTATVDEMSGITEDYTLGRYKADTSKGYVRNIRSSYDGATTFTLVACAGDGSSTYYEDFKLYPQEVYPGKDAYLTNLVKESGYNYAAVKIEPGPSYLFETEIAWSPDNYNGY